METGRARSKQTLKFGIQRYENLTPELLTKSVWVSTALAMIFALPPIAIFIGLYETGMNIGIAAGIGFGVHFATLAFAKRIVSMLGKLFD
ncbi:MAG TPA: hypothetical protein VH677_02425 [Nitrososphaera sp.]|jgi:hypothetical protein